jgi:uncharacterized membrane protein
VDALSFALLLATLLCGLVAGFLFAFAVVVMPGLRSLSAAEYLRAFQVLDGVIQRNNPLFLLLWVGSVIALLAAAGLGFGQLEGLPRALLLGAAGVYLLGVQLPTIVFNIPLNNELASLVVSELEASAQEALRAKFETRWTRSNTARTVLACLVTGLLLTVVRGA